MRRILPLLLALVLLGCTAAPSVPAVVTQSPTAVTTAPPVYSPTEVSTESTIETTVPETSVQRFAALMDSMDTEELVGQLFLAHFPGYPKAAADIEKYHLGGFLLFGSDFANSTPQRMNANLQTLQQQSRIPLLIATDEEGGTVTRVSSHSQHRSDPFPSPRSLYDEGGLDLILQIEEEKCKLLLSTGVNVNLAPVCDIATDPHAFMYKRSLGQDPETTAQYAASVVQTMDHWKIGSVLKHFPGYGNNTDTHIGEAVDDRSLQALAECDLLPFRAGIDAGCDAILVSHTVVRCLDDRNPATLSPEVIDYLRDTMGFDGVIITDDLHMDAITSRYSAPSAAMLAVMAGNDLLCTSDYEVQYEAILQKVYGGTISMEQLRNSVARILKWKEDLGILNIQ